YGALNNSYRTLSPLQYPPHVVALACLYLAALLSTFEMPQSDEHQSSRDIAAKLGQKGDWEDQYFTQASDLEGKPLVLCLLKLKIESFRGVEICHALLDLLIASSSSLLPSTSPT